MLSWLITLKSKHDCLAEAQQANEAKRASDAQSADKHTSDTRAESHGAIGVASSSAGAQSPHMSMARVTTLETRPTRREATRASPLPALKWGRSSVYLSHGNRYARPSCGHCLVYPHARVEGEAHGRTQ